MDNIAEIWYLKGFVAGKAVRKQEERTRMMISEKEYELLVEFSDWVREQGEHKTMLENSDELVARFLDEKPDE